MKSKQTLRPSMIERMLVAYVGCVVATLGAGLMFHVSLTWNLMFGSKI